jgi:hypothetical protein
LGTHGAVSRGWLTGVPCRAVPWAKWDSRLSQPRLAYSAGAQLVRPHGAPSEGGRRAAGGGGWLSPSRPTGNPASPEPSYWESRSARAVLLGIPLSPSRPTGRIPLSPSRPTGDPAPPEPSYRESRSARTVLPGIPLSPNRPTGNPVSPEPSYWESRSARTVLPGIPLSPNRPTGNLVPPEPSFRESRSARTGLPGIPLRPNRPTGNPALGRRVAGDPRTRSPPRKGAARSKGGRRRPLTAERARHGERQAPSCVCVFGLSGILSRTVRAKWDSRGR